MKRRAWMLVAAAVSAAEVNAAPAPAPPKIEWVRQPAAGSLYATWSDAAKLAAGGAATMHCKVGPQGLLSNCTIVDEAPTGVGYGLAALALMPEYVAPAASPTELTFRVDFKPLPANSGAIVPPTWRKSVGDLDVRRYWPVQAMRREQGGRASYRCKVDLRGRLFDCRTLEEEPAGQHFGDAALAMTSQLLMSPATFRGEPVISEFTSEVEFRTVEWPSMADTPSHLFGAAEIPWQAAPSVADMLAAYPSKARAGRLGGSAMLECLFTRAGNLGLCDIIGEEPESLGFGRAAQNLAKRFRAPEYVGKGRSVGGLVVKLRFQFAPTLADAPIPAVEPTWVEAPSPPQIAGAFADVASRAGVTRVNATVDCLVGPAGDLDDCRVVAEQPSGRDVGKVALSLAARFKAQTWTETGAPVVGGRIRIPMSVDLEPGRPAAS